MIKSKLQSRIKAAAGNDVDSGLTGDFRQQANIASQRSRRTINDCLKTAVFQFGYSGLNDLLARKPFFSEAPVKNLASAYFVTILLIPRYTIRQ